MLKISMPKKIMLTTKSQKLTIELLDFTILEPSILLMI